jgi:hypothetical protein
MPLEYLCQYCHASFSTKSNLSTHKKRTKKCLAIQNKLDIENLFACSYCEKTFTKKQSLQEHLDICIIKTKREKDDSTDKIERIYKKMIKDLKDENEILKQQVKDLQDKLGDIAEIGAKKNTVRVNANIINQLAPYDLNREKIYAIVNEHFTEDHLYARENGIANFAVNNLLQENGNLKMTCTDTARKLFIYKDKNGNLYKDPNANEFLETYIPSVKRKSYEIISNKDGTEMIELTECMLTIEPSTLTNLLVGKLTPKPK